MNETLETQLSLEFCKTQEPTPLVKEPSNIYIYIYNSDCLQKLKEIPDNSVDLVVTDPPYEVNVASGGGSIKAKFMAIKRDLANADITNGYDIETIGNELLRVCRKPNLYIFCNKKQIPQYIDFYVNKHKCSFDILCWHKKNPIPSYSNKYMTDTEYCLYFRKGGYCKPQNYDYGKTWWIEPINAKDKKIYQHPTIKPLNIIERLIINSSLEGQTVLDPFMGVGTTGVACKKLGRNFIGIEIDPKWVEIGRKRIDETE